MLRMFRCGVAIVVFSFLVGVFLLVVSFGKRELARDSSDVVFTKDGSRTNNIESGPRTSESFQGKGFVHDNGSIQWYSERKEIEAPLLFKKHEENREFFARIHAWEVGREIGNDNRIILVAFDSNEPGGISTFLFTEEFSDNGQSIRLIPMTRYSSSDFGNSFSIEVNEDIVDSLSAVRFGRVNSLEYPGYLSYQDGFFSLQVPEVPDLDHVFFSPQEGDADIKIAFVDSVFGPAYLNETSETLSFRSPYGTEIRYGLVPNFFQDDVPQITWSDGSKNADTFSRHSTSSCGGTGSGVNPESSIIEERDLVQIGQTSSGDRIYGYKDTNQQYLRAWYQENLDFLETTGDSDYSDFFSKETTYEDFVQNRLIFFWKNPLGHFSPFLNEKFIFSGGCGKPVIYLYPEKKEKVSVRVTPNGGMTFSDPPYSDGWNVIADPDGQILNLSDKRLYSYLFWEGDAHSSYDAESSGFVVEENKLEVFFDGILRKLGLNSRESADFKEFWIPRMLRSGTPYYFVTFLPQSVIDRMAPLNVSPSPASVIRVLMRYRGLSERIDVKPLEISTPERKGFTVVEWGGSLR